ncbi:hypothetical protein KJ359_004500 [Pestalotiopsis sp. 9143b]|nr:hypothetical protein KJ359_004500 [Pestalotiopsis sp. 9143b]
MAAPLSPLPSAALNITTTPATARRVAQEETMDGTPADPNAPAAEAPDASANQSSPFVSEVQDNKTDSPSKENPSPSKIRHSRILSGNEIAPLTLLLSPRDENMDPEARSPSRQDSRSKSPRRPRFPIRPTGSSSSPAKPIDSIDIRSPEKSPERSPEKEPEKSPFKAPDMMRESSLEKHMVKANEMTLEDALNANEGLKKAIQIFEDESTMMESDDLPGDADAGAMDVDHPAGIDDSIAGPDESMVSTFSTFSAVPNLTMFAKIGHSPTRFANTELTPASARGRPDPSPSRSVRGLDGGNNTTSLLEFSDQLARNGTFSSKRARLSPAKTSGHRPSATPQRGPLIDFDMPPLPTPRSVPTVTAREVETLKSQFLSEISSLKASLLGKEAEASSLKTAVTDAEKRVGETSEQLRELKALKETLLEDKQTWEKRCQEMEDVLRRVKAEIHHGQRERQELESKFDESEKRREAAEIMAQEAESKMAGMRAGRVSPDSGADNKSPKSGSREVEIAVERVARELHALYKSKHEKKVTALKKSYANSWEKKVHALESTVKELGEENDKMRQAQETSILRVEESQAAENQELRAQNAQQSGQITELKAEVKQLGASIASVKQDNTELIQLLEKERVEKGELVSLAEEMMSMQQSFIQQQEKEKEEEKPAPRSARKLPEPPSAKKGLARPAASGLRAPGMLKKSATESRIGGIGHERTKSGGPQLGLPRPSMMGMGARSGIMSSIEKMGNHRRGE